METTLDFSRWREKPKGLAYRRWVIVSAGFQHLSRGKLFRGLLTAAWFAGVMVAGMGFVFTQALASGGWLESFAAHFGPRAQAVVSAFSGMVMLYPDVCIGGLFTSMFYAQSFVGLTLSLIALSVVVPGLVTRDRASNALTIYLSRPLTSLDYLIGKLGVIVGILLLLWTGPLVFGWLLSMAFAPGMDFLRYSVKPLLHAGMFNLIALIALAAIALGVSAVSKSSRNTIILWMGLWIVAGWLAEFPTTPDWMRSVSFSHDLSQARKAIFRLDEALASAGASLSFVNQNFSRHLDHAGELARTTDLFSALAGLGVLTAVSCVVFFRKLKPE